MKVVLFCGGLGTRIRDYSENIPKPMIPVGHQPILRHLMEYYSGYGHSDFVLCLGYKSQIIKEFFINEKPCMFNDCVVANGGRDVQIIGNQPDDWRVTLIDTGVWRNIGQRLWAVRDQVANEPMFMANYSDGLCDVDLDDMVARFRASDKVACFLAVRPPLTYHLVDVAEDGDVRDLQPAQDADIWINGGFFLFRPEIFDYMRDGEELVLEPFQRLIAENRLMAYKYTGFWRSMDTLRDWQSLQELVERGETPWLRKRPIQTPPEPKLVSAR
jgi:glucose-1-phosphate cytidylyltransferase